MSVNADGLNLQIFYRARQIVPGIGIKIPI